jgi:hypothetical protein
VNRTRWLATVAAALAVVLGGGAAPGASGSTNPASDFLGDVAERLGISKDELEGAIADEDAERAATGPLASWCCGRTHSNLVTSERAETNLGTAAERCGPTASSPIRSSCCSKAPRLLASDALNQASTGGRASLRGYPGEFSAAVRSS